MSMSKSTVHGPMWHMHAWCPPCEASLAVGQPLLHGVAKRGPLLLAVVEVLDGEQLAAERRLVRLALDRRARRLGAGRLEPVLPRAPRNPTLVDFKLYHEEGYMTPSTLGCRRPTGRPPLPSPQSPPSGGFWGAVGPLVLAIGPIADAVVRAGSTQLTAADTFSSQTPTLRRCG